MKKIWLYAVLLAAEPSAKFATAQERGSERLMTVSRTNSSITIDGEMKEEDWNRVQSTSPFLNKWPLDSGYAEAKTEVRMLFNDQFVYVFAINHQRREDLIIQTLKRDQLDPFWNSDGFAVVLDPINQKSNGFMFGVNAGGAQIDGAINVQGNWTMTNENWDNKWFSAVRVYDEYWTAELAIPFSALRFKDNGSEWGMNFIRNDLKRNVYSTWSFVPRQFYGTDLGHMGKLRWAEPLTPNKSKVTLIPYLSGQQSRNYEDGEDTKTRGGAGLDAKVSLTSSLNLDLTLRPDFSNVEVDRQMTNVTRFSLLYPERRNFFLENADLFTGFGSWLVKPFFSRRIGLYDGEAIPIIAGARLSGNITPGLRIGVMDVQTEATDEFSGNNYFVAALHQRIFSRSTLKFMATNRKTTETREGDSELDYNRTVGGEFQFVSKDGNLSTSVRGHTSATPEDLDENNYLSGQISYVNKKLYTGLMYERVGQNYVNDLGFIPRLHVHDAQRDTTVRIGYNSINPWLGILIYPKNSKVINVIEPNTWSVINYRTTGEFLDRFTSVNLMVQFKDTRKLIVDVTNNDINLPFPSDILDNDRPIPVARYRFTQYLIKYSTDNRKPLSGDASFSAGNFYNGTRFEYGVTVNMRRQPWGMFGVSYLQNDINLPEEYGSTSFILIGPRAEVSLRHNIWWTTFLQFNTQAENFNINSRLQWRYKPMSDLFVVYTDNYATTDMKVKNRGVVVKLTYWLNL